MGKQNGGDWRQRRKSIPMASAGALAGAGALPQARAMTAPGGRIDLHGLATDAGAAERGAVMGPEALRIAGLGDVLRALGHTVDDRGDFRVPPAERTAEKRRAEIIAVAAEASMRGYETLRTGGLPVFMGGDHSISMGSVSGVAKWCLEQERELFVLWFDAHGDFNTPASSPSGNLHGMALALLCGEPEFDDAFGGSWRIGIEPSNVTLFGTRSIDTGERVLLEERGIEVIDMRTIDEQGTTAPIRRLIERVAAAEGHLHVSLDVDAMDPAIGPGVGTTVAGGLTYREAHLVMELLHDAGIVGSLDIVELNPFLDHAGQSARLLVDLAASLFGRRIMSRRE
jgi:arginase